MTIRSRRGIPVTSRYGLFVLPADSDAPNAVDIAETVTVVFDDPTRRYATIETAADLSGYAEFQIVWKGRDANGEPLAYAYRFPAATGEIPGGVEALGPFNLSTPTHYSLCLIDSDGIGFPGPDKAISEPPDIPDFAVTENPSIDAVQVEGSVLVFNAVQFTGEATFSYVYSTADDGSGTNDSGVQAWEDDTLLVPMIDGAADYFRIGALFEGVDSPGPYWSDYIRIDPQEAVVTPVTLAAAQIVATNRLAVDGVSMLSVGPTLTAGTATAEIITYVSEGANVGTLYLGPITNGPIADDTPVTWTGGAGVANGPSTAYPLTAGQAFYVRPAVFNGAPTSNVVRLEKATSNAGDGAVLADWAGVIPAPDGGLFFRHTHRVAGEGITGTQDFSTAWIEIQPPTLAKIAATEWPVVNTTTTSEGKTRLVSIYLLASLGATAVWWTTGQNAYLEANQHPIGREPMTLSGTVSYLGQTYQIWLANDAIAGGKNYRDFGTDEAARASRLGIIAQIGGALTPVSDRKSVPLPVATGTRSWHRSTQRGQGQAEEDEDGGTGMQFPRAFDTWGDFVAMGFDITTMMFSTDFGDTYFTNPYPGLFCDETFSGVACDGTSTGPRFVHVQVGAGSLQTVGDYGDKAGYYRLDLNSGQWGAFKALAEVFGSNKSPQRNNLHYIAIVPDSGTGPTTRTLYQIHAPCPFSNTSGWSTIQLYRSTNGGDSWATRGSAISGVTSSSVPYGIACSAAGAVYLFRKTGLWRMDASGTTWVQCTFPSSAGANPWVSLVRVVGTKVYACVRGKGIYLADEASDLNSGTKVLSFSLPSGWSGDFWYFDVSKANSNRILACGPSSLTPKVMTNGTSFSNVTTNKFTGQWNDFEHKIHGEQAWFKWHDTDQTKAIAMRYHHMGKSTDSGSVFRWSGANFCYSGVQELSFGTTWRNVLLTMTDRLVTFSPSAMDFVMDDGISDANKLTIAQRIAAIEGDTWNGEKLSAYSAAGALILENNGHTGIVTQIGNDGAKPRTPVLLSRTVTLKSSTGTGGGSISYTASKDLPGGFYTFRCTATASNGGTFTGTAPSGIDMGSFVVGTQRVWTHPWGGTLTITINDGNPDFGLSKVFIVEVNPIGSATVPANSIKTTAVIAGRNPDVPSTGFSGRHRYSLSASGVLSLDGTITNDFVGFSDANVCYSANGDSNALYRSINGGSTFPTGAWWSGGSGSEGSFGGLAIRAVSPSTFDNQCVYIGTRTGKIKRLQGGSSGVTETTIFDLDAYCDANGITDAFPGHAVVGGRRVPAVTGVVESYYDEELIYFTLHMVGAPYYVFRIRNAKSSTGHSNSTIDNITSGPGGLTDAINSKPTSLRIHPITDEPVVTSRHGTIWFDPGDTHRATWGITSSICAQLRATRNTLDV